MTETNAALARCPSCHASVSKEAKACPQCGHPEPGQTAGSKMFCKARLIVGIGLLFIVAALALPPWLAPLPVSLGISGIVAIAFGSLIAIASSFRK